MALLDGTRWGGLVALAVAASACSDDGLNPQDDTSGTGAATAPGSGPNDGDGGSSATPATTGAGTGGADGVDTGGDGTGSTGGDTQPPVPCMADRDCQLVNDCCACGAAHVDEMIECDMPPCFAPLCEAKFGGAPTPVCELGECTIEWDCNELLVTCDTPAPKCPDGMLPSVVEGCYAGSCVPASECNAVPDCTWCTKDEACVENQTQVGVFFACEPMPPECGGVASCACLPEACNPEIEVCMDTDGGVACTCPAC